MWSSGPDSGRFGNPDTLFAGIGTETGLRLNTEPGSCVDGAGALHEGSTPKDRVLHEDVRATALLDQLNAVDDRAERLGAWRAWRIPLTSVVMFMTMSIAGLGYQDPVGLLIYTSILVGPLADIIMRRRLRRSLVHEREQIVSQHGALVTLAAQRRDSSKDSAAGLATVDVESLETMHEMDSQPRRSARIVDRRRPLKRLVRRMWGCCGRPQGRSGRI